MAIPYQTAQIYKSTSIFAISHQYFQLYGMSCLYGTCVHQLLCRLKRKIACKIRDEHSLVKDLPPPNETVAKMAAKHLPLASAKQGIKNHTLS